MAKARKFGLGGTIKKVAEKAVEKKDPALDSVRKKQADLAKKGIAADPPRTPGGKVIAVPFKGDDTPTKPPVKGIDTPIPGVKTSATGPSKGIDTPVPAVKTGATGPSKGVISKVAELKDIKTPQIRPSTSTAPAVQSERLNAVKDMARPSTPPAEKGLGAVAPSATAGINAVQNVVKKAVPQVAQATKMPAPAANQVFKPKTMKKGGKTSCYSSGGSTSGASKRGDGIAIRGKTRGKIC